MIHGHDYSVYSGSPSARTGVYAWLAILSAFVSIIVTYLLTSLLLYLSSFFGVDNSMRLVLTTVIGSVTPLAAFGTLTALFDVLLWKRPLGRAIFFFARARRPPFIGGNYVGTSHWFDLQEDGSKGEKGESSVRATIEQTWERICVVFQFPDSDSVPRSRSHSDMAYIESSFDSSSVRLQYTYSYEEHRPVGPHGAIKNRTIRGTCSLQFEKREGGWIASGAYYADSGASGEVRLEQLSIKPAATASSPASPDGPPAAAVVALSTPQ
jgi:hypothetical protein